MYTATSGLMFDTPEDAERAADLLKALMQEAQARQPSKDADSVAQGRVLDPAGDVHPSNLTK